MNKEWCPICSESDCDKKVNKQVLRLLQILEEERAARLKVEALLVISETDTQKAHLATRELQTKNKQLEQFAYVVSHDLQEPLRTITGFIKLLQNKYEGKFDERADSYLDFITEASNRMKKLINDLLDFSVIGTKSVLRRIDCNIVMQDLLNDLMKIRKEANADIQFSALPEIMGYPTQIKLLFQNLIVNAIKFRRKDVTPEIAIAAEKIKDYWQFTVRDNGIGIEEQYTQKVFEIFQQLYTHNEYRGYGIGLSHCKKIVDLHHGKIWVESIPGKGSTFYFTLLVTPPNFNKNVKNEKAET